jgi:hypothetical protein
LGVTWLSEMRLTHRECNWTFRSWQLHRGLDWRERGGFRVPPTRFGSSIGFSMYVFSWSVRYIYTRCLAFHQSGWYKNESGFILVSNAQSHLPL